MKKLRALLLSVVLLTAGLAGPALATPVTVQFTGSGGFGIGAADLTAAQNAGVPVLNLTVEPADPYLTIFAQELNQITPFPANGSEPHTAVSTWRMENPDDAVPPRDLATTYLVFATTVDYTVGGSTVSYDNAKVGLTIDAADGWVIVQSTGGNFYPAINVGALESGMISDPFVVRYFIDGPVTQVGQTYYLPQFIIGRAEVPEPGTFALFGLGLVGLAATRRRRR
jgi:hypothetical protein